MYDVCVSVCLGVGAVEVDTTTSVRPSILQGGIGSPLVVPYEEYVQKCPLCFPIRYYVIKSNPPPDL